MLKLLPDEHISPDVADGLRRRNRSLVIHCMAGWENVIFVDEKTISPADIGGLVRALAQVSKETGKWVGLDGPSLLLTASPLIVPSAVHEAVAIAPKPCGFSNSLERSESPYGRGELPQELQKPRRKVAALTGRAMFSKSLTKPLGVSGVRMRILI